MRKGAFRVYETGKGSEGVGNKGLKGGAPLNAFDLLKGFETKKASSKAISASIP